MANFTARAVVIAWAICVGVVVVSGQNEDLASDWQALLNLRKAVGGRLNGYGWNGNSSNVCKWKGVTCDSEPRVVSVSLPGAELSGSIPVGILGNLTSLRKLRLRFNALRGPLPPDLSNCKNLRTLYLQGNHFSGSLPWDFSVWRGLSRLNLASNNLSGPLPDSLKSLKRLGSLLLENNSFTGAIPPLDLPKLVYFNVSYNNLSGPVPDSLRKFYPDSFLGNQISCGSCTKKSKKHRWALILGIVVGVVVVVCSIMAVLLLISRRKKTGKAGNVPAKKAEKQSTSEIDSSFTKDEYSISLQEPDRMNNKLIFLPSSNRAFSLEDLLRASAELLGRGIVGTAYKAVLETGNVVVVKRMRDTPIGPRSFAQMISALGNMHHPNLLPLKAYYYSKDEKLLVYDYMPSGSLASLLHGTRGVRRSPLDWRSRVHLALGTAMGIEYLHKQGSKISHGNIKSSNILITENSDACVCDFGLAQMVSSTPIGSGSGSGSGSGAGERRIGGYRAPEVSERGKVSQEADVYSFGVLLLELLTGKSATQQEGVDLPRWVQSVVREEWTVEVFDMDLMRLQNWPCPDEDEMLHLLQLGMSCVAHYPDQRPTMSQVVKMIQDISSSTPKSHPQTPQLR
ncbi:hypothetical protein SUGI_0927010 [Cryptomeria japonica]|uniref:probable inactive receptor kinase At1g48480 n=1 Tax=Cryptomeria japonica TaxID=3369 RepID=UPI0024147C9A|nr:probable inactive receptor kinase At1g48480 [Cryptomeria japonica]GLJ44294.1 hypothetical protein SUGI_0927010 [Cryptomeria japonica]